MPDFRPKGLSGEQKGAIRPLRTQFEQGANGAIHFLGANGAIHLLAPKNRGWPHPSRSPVIRQIAPVPWGGKTEEEGLEFQPLFWYDACLDACNCWRFKSINVTD